MEMIPSTLLPSGYLTYCCLLVFKESLQAVWGSGLNHPALKASSPIPPGYLTFQDFFSCLLAILPLKFQFPVPKPFSNLPNSNCFSSLCSHSILFVCIVSLIPAFIFVLSILEAPRTQGSCLFHLYVLQRMAQCFAHIHSSYSLSVC